MTKNNSEGKNLKQTLSNSSNATARVASKVVVIVARVLVVLFLLANALANIIHWFDGKHVDHQMAIGAGVVTMGVCLYIYFIKK